MKVGKECLEGCLRGESAYQRELYDLLVPYLNGICGRYLDNTSHRKDVLQEAFILIFKKINQFDSSKGAFHSWASRIVINLSLKQNKSGKKLVHFQAEKGEETIAVAPDVISQMSNEELIRFLRTMPPKFYEVFILFVVDGYAHEEIAEILGIKVSLSRKRLVRARTWFNFDQSIE
ncbi:MAG: RNA polymerase sigma factor (sigma-70 family) [Flavobacteriales bacterium]|jgi:RNA polymerase sigma factor (sigma-70 family)